MTLGSRAISAILLASGLVVLAGCQEQVSETLPPPIAMTEEAVGYFCQMNILEHPGPKAQIHLDGLPYPLFFSQVRDGIAYDRMPEQNYKIRVIYVTDMSKSADWNNVGRENWIAATSAHFVVGSNMAGGMGSPELVPFSNPDDAQKFAEQHGGQVVRLADIDDATVLDNAALNMSHPSDEIAHTPDEDDYRGRLEKLRKE